MPGSIISALLLAAYMATGRADSGLAPDHTQSTGRERTLSRARRIENLIDDGDLKAARRELAAGGFSELVQLTLRGRLALADGGPGRAERAFGRAIALAPDHLPLRVLQAHAQLAGKRYAAVLTTLEHHGLDPTDPPIALLRATAYRELDRSDDAYAQLASAANAHPSVVALRQELVLLCAAAGLFETAGAWATTITPKQLGPDVAVLALQRLRGTAGALPFARFIASGFPDDPQVQEQLGWALSAGNELAAAAAALARASALGANVAFAAAEHYRAAHRYREALRLNARVSQDNKRVRQRFDILFESGAMARTVAAGDRLEDAGGLSPRRRYNVAYAHYALRQYAEASRHARALADTGEAQRARALLRAMGR